MKHLFFLLFFATNATAILSQSGYEGLYIEQYHRTSASQNLDTNYSGSIKPGSITYRVYVDLLPGYRLQAVYGTPESPIVINSSTPFYNHASNGQTHPNIIPQRSMFRDAVMLDSWLSMGASGENTMAIPLIHDDYGLDSLLPSGLPVLNDKQKKQLAMFREKDGLKWQENLPFPTFFQMDSALKHLGSTTNGHTIEITNGAWASLGRGSIGLDSLTNNMILIGQFTTEGDLELKLNLMISSPAGESQKYTYGASTASSMHHDKLHYKARSRGRKIKYSTIK
jgi:hypothetical protein